MKTIFPIVIVSVLLMSAGLLRAVPGDEHWDAQFGWPGPGENVGAVAIRNGQIYVSGAANPLTNAPVEVWNGAQWNAIGQVYGYPEAFVYDAAFVGNYLYIAGIFTNVSGVAATGLARWDGSNWSSVGFSGSLFALAVSGNNLYVAGGFTNATADGSVATNIASWDGSAWHALGGGLGGVVGGLQVTALAIQNGTVYAGGAFTNSSLAVTNLAVWNGSSWSGFGGGANGTVLSLAFNGGNLIAAGSFTQIGTTAANCVAQWNGATWSALGSGLTGGSPVNEAIHAAVFNGTIYVSGTFTTAGGIAAPDVASWNGSSWSALGAGVNGGVSRVFSNGTNLYVGGAFSLAGGTVANGFASWDGANWRSIGPAGRLNGVNTTVAALATDGTNLFAGGAFVGAGQTNADFIARFDGTNWYPLGSGISSASGTLSIRALAMGTNGLYVGGQFSSAGGVSAANIAFWNRTNWSALGAGPGGVVASIVVNSNGVFAVGAPSGTSGYGAPFFMRWDGTNWYNAFYTTNSFFSELINSPTIEMGSVASIGTNIFVGGQFSFAQGDQNFISDATSCPDIFRDDGNYAYIMGTGVNSNVLAMAAMGTNLYVAGYFTNAGGIAASHIAMWNGGTWSAVGSGVVGTGYVLAMAALGTNLYAAGSFTNIGGVAANRVARWDGSNWWPLGSGVVRSSSLPGTVDALCSSGNNLYVGGPFGIAGNKPSYNVAHWNDQVNFNTPKIINPKWLGAGQFQARLYGVSGVTNIVQATTNFTVWTPILTNSAGIYDFNDSNSPSWPYRFYRGALSQ